MAYFEDLVKPLQKYIDLYEKYKDVSKSIQNYRNEFINENTNDKLALDIASTIMGGIESRTKDKEVKNQTVDFLHTE